MLLYFCRINCGERMKKITIAIKDNSLIFKFRTNKPVGPNLLNTNVISNNELVFSDEYIKENSITEEDIQTITENCEILNKIGIPLTSFYIIFTSVVKIIILCVGAIV